MKLYTAKNDYYSITVSTHGAELVSMKGEGGFEHIWQCGGDWKDQSPLLFPVCGRIKDEKYSYKGKEYPMSSHGFAKKSEFSPVEATDNRIVMELKSNEETKKIYPFDFSLIASYELVGEELIFTATVKNTGNEPLPYMFGWHPGFNLMTNGETDINDYRLDFPGIDSLNWFALQNGPFVNPKSTEYKLTDNAYQLCESEIYANDTMIFTGHENKTVLYSNGAPFTLEFSWSDNLPYLCIWKEEFNSAKYVCLEPWSDVPADGVADEDFEIRKMRRLASGESASYIYKVKAYFKK
ncbi:MAG: hypothetical protein J6V09_01605 [Clostridia bacterium]|nr:hypothetical protein [Clostridia bacterium]